MAGSFTMIKDVAFASLDWGRVAALCNPSGTGARQLTILDGRVFPGKGHDFHFHPNQEEVILVISGQIEQWIEKEKRILGPGDTVFIPPNTVHASFNIGTTDANIVAIFGPSVGTDGLEMTDVSKQSPWSDLRKSS